ncbi:MAG: GTP 3',8-cyclase MoaA [Desulfobacteraceae bacterium]|nr:GTP 3',8-cyclase MoaA [Desulfobacteraceae bacterium]
MTDSVRHTDLPRPSPEGDSLPEGGSHSRLVDAFARTISYLRVSLTDHCNLRCLYCTPKEAGEKLAGAELLTYEEILRVVELAVGLGIRKVRLTGGEPLVRRGVLDFIGRLTAIPGLRDIRLTTNGVLLPDMAAELFRAGIRKLNVSLDTLKPERFREITGADCFERVWTGIRLARKIGFDPVKINVVVLKGVNDDELLDFGRLTLTEPYQVRFIEFMPVGQGTAWSRDRYVSSTDIRERLAALAPLLPSRGGAQEGPASVYRFEGAAGSLGFISPISHQFCDRCNRLRLTAEGRLRSCLLSDEEIDLKAVLRGDGSDTAIEKALLQATLNKPKGHQLAQNGFRNCHGQMSRIGG